MDKMFKASSKSKKKKKIVIKTRDTFDIAINIIFSENYYKNVRYIL